MLWIFVALGSAVFFSLGAFVDNYLADVHFRRYGAGIMVGFAVVSSVTMMGILGVVRGGDIFTLSFGEMGILAGAGALDVVGYCLYFLALKGEEATDAAVLQQFSPVFALILSVFLVGEVVVGKEILAFGLIFLAAIWVV